jgi:hypothetical protein
LCLIHCEGLLVLSANTIEQESSHLPLQRFEPSKPWPPKIPPHFFMLLLALVCQKNCQYAHPYVDKNQTISVVTQALL